MLEICDIKFFPDGRSVVDTVGGRRFRVISKSMKEGYHIARVEFLDEVKVDGNELNGEVIALLIVSLFSVYSCPYTPARILLPVYSRAHEPCVKFLHCRIHHLLLARLLP